MSDQEFGYSPAVRDLRGIILEKFGVFLAYASRCTNNEIETNRRRLKSAD